MKVVLDCDICGNEFRVDLVHEHRRGDRPEDRDIKLYGPDDSLWEDLNWDPVCPACEKSIVDAIRTAVKARQPSQPIQSKGTVA